MTIVSISLVEARSRSAALRSPKVLPRFLGLKPRPVLPSYQVLLAHSLAPVLSSIPLRLSAARGLDAFGGAGSLVLRRRGVSALKDGFVLNCQLSTVGQIGTMLVEGKEIGANTSVSALTLPMKRESPLLKDGELSSLHGDIPPLPPCP